jgi:hypothetical protein
MPTHKETFGSTSRVTHERRLLNFFEEIGAHFVQWLIKDIQRGSHGYPEAKMANGTLTVWRPFDFPVGTFCYQEANIRLTLQISENHEVQILVTDLDGKPKPSTPVYITFPCIQSVLRGKTNPQGKKNTPRLLPTQIKYLTITIVGPALAPKTIPISARVQELLEGHHDDHDHQPEEDD